MNGSLPETYFRQSFMSAAKVFHAIDSPTQGVIVPYKKGKTIINGLCATADVKRQYELLRDAQRYSVNVFPNVWAHLMEEEALHEIEPGIGIYYLDERYYDENFGLSTTRVNEMPFLSDC